MLSIRWLALALLGALSGHINEVGYPSKRGNHYRWWFGMRGDKGIVTTESDRTFGHCRHLGSTKDIDIAALPAVCRLPKWPISAANYSSAWLALS